MRKRTAFIFCAVLFAVSVFAFAACTDDYGSETADGEYRGSTVPVNGELYNTASVYAEITITAGDMTLNAVLFDNKTARAVADMLPLTVSTWHPAHGFARAFNLPQSFSYFDEEPPQMSYELGSLAYWEPGPSIAMIYKASRTQTVVPVVPIGKITSNLSVLENYGGNIIVDKNN